MLDNFKRSLGCFTLHVGVKGLTPYFAFHIQCFIVNMHVLPVH